MTTFDGDASAGGRSDLTEANAFRMQRPRLKVDRPPRSKRSCAASRLARRHSRGYENKVKANLKPDCRTLMSVTTSSR